MEKNHTAIHHRLKSRLKWRYRVAVLIVAVISIFSQWILQTHFAVNQNESFIVNVAGRQRMLSQKIGKKVLMLDQFSSLNFPSGDPVEKAPRNLVQLEVEPEKVRGQLAEIIALFKETHERLQTRSGNEKFRGENSPEIQLLFRGLQPHFEELVSNAICFTDSQKICGADEVRAVLNSEFLFLQLMEKIVASYSENLAETFQLVGSIELMLLFITLLILSLEMAFIFEPAVKLVGETLSKLSHEQKRAAHLAKVQSLGEMAGGIAHEINNPLAIIKGKAMQFRKKAEWGPLSTEEIQASADKIIGTVDRIDAIVKGLLRIAHSGELNETQEVDVNSLIADVMALCNEKAQNLGINIDVRSNEPVAVQCRPTELAQVVTNIINNAIYACQSSSEKKIDIEFREVGNMIQLSVANTGPEIPHDLRDKVFQPFFTTKPVGTGTGLGLSVSRSLMEDMGGELDLDTRSQTTKFVIRVPKSKAA